MDTRLAPDPILRAALRVVHVAGYTTRNWTCGDEVSRKQINDLWKAMHVVPELVMYWRDDEECLEELRMYLRGYDERWEAPKLERIFDHALGSPDI